MTVSVIGVVGAGFIGSGIAESAAAAGNEVIVYEPDDRSFERSRESLGASVGRAVSRGKLDHDAGEQLVDRVLYTTRFEDLGSADAVIEAITEDVKIKSYAVCESLYEEFKRPEYAPPSLMKRMVVSGHHGRKTGRGFYEYPPVAQTADAAA